MPRLTFLFFVLLNIQAFAQNSGLFSEQSTHTANLLQLIESKSYEAAAVELNHLNYDVLTNIVLHGYVTAVIEMELNSNTGPAIQYAKEESNQYFKNDLIARLGDYFYQDRDYNQSIRWFSQADLNNNEQLLHHAKALHFLSHWDEAMLEYQKITRGEYYSEAQLELGKLLWEQDQKQEAIGALEIASQDNQLRHKTQPYFATYYFDQKQYEKALMYTSESSFNDENNQANLLMIRGKSLQKVGRPKDALNEYLALQRQYPDKIDEEILWSISEVAQQSNDTKVAVSTLNELIQSDSPYKQSAAFKLGSLLVLQDSFQEAALAFQIAQEGANEGIAKKALINLAKTNFKSGLYEEAVRQLTNYQELYPKSDPLVTTELITQSHFLSSDFEKTLNYIESRSNLSPTVRKIYQLVSYENAKRYFSDQRYDQATTYLKQSISVPLEKTILEKSELMLADIYSYQLQYDQAIPWYQKLLKTNDRQRRIKVLYGLAYANYNSQQYEEALRFFRNLNNIQETPIDILTEADVRIADCLYVTKSYEQAKQYYLRLRNSTWSMHVKYQLAQIYQLTEENDKAIQMLTEVVRQDSVGSFKVKSSLLLGEIYLDQSEFQSAIDAVDSLIADFPSHELVPNAQFVKSIAATNLTQFAVAEAALKYILDEVKDEELLKNALFGLQTLQNKGHEVSDFSYYFNQIAEERADDEDLIRIAYESAKAPYFNQSYEEAINSLTKFIARYSQRKPKDIYYFLGDAYFRTQKYGEAITAFDSALQNGPGNLQGRIYDKRGSSFLQMGSHSEAAQNYEQWVTVAKNDREAYQARQGLIRAFGQQGAYQKVLELITVQESSPWKPINFEQELALIKSDAYENLQDYDKATDELIQLMNTSEGEKAAIAHLRFAKLQARDNNYLQSNETLLQLIGDFASYPNQTQAAYLQLIANYQLLGNSAQAKAIAQSIIDNGTDSVFVTQATEMMQEIINRQNSEASDSLNIK